MTEFTTGGFRRGLRAKPGVRIPGTPKFRSAAAIASLLALALSVLTLLGASAARPSSASASVIERVSVGGDGSEANHGSYLASLSGDGRFVSFTSGAPNLVTGDTNGAWDVFVKDRLTGAVERVSVSTGRRRLPAGERIRETAVDTCGVAYE